MKTKFIISILSPLFLVASLLIACGGKQPAYPEMVPLKITISNKMSFAPIYISEAEGYFTEYGLKMEYITIADTLKAIPLLVSGDVDIYAGAISAGLLNTIYQDNNIKAVADRGHVTQGGCTYTAVLIRKDLYESGEVKGPADLKGLTLSTASTGVGGYLLGTYLSQAGLTFKDIKMVDLNQPSEIAAYGNKVIDGGTTTEPNLTAILGSGEVVILAKAEDVVGTYQTGVIAFNKKLLVDHPDIGARFLAAYLKGVRKYNEGKTERNLEILAKATGQTVENLKTICWVAINNDGLIDFAGVDGFQQWSIAQGQLENPVTEEQFWDPSILTAAQKMLKQ